MDENEIVVPDELPSQAKNIYAETYRKVIEGFNSLEHVKGIINKKMDNQSASDIAWIAVKEQFTKKNGRWIKKEK